MGKVGSATVRETLIKAKLPNPIYHIHFLSHDGIKNAENYFLSLKTPLKSNHLKRSKMLRKIIEANSNIQWKIITLVREPIARDISDLFQTIDRYFPDLVENGKVKTNEAMDLLLKRFANYDQDINYTCTWFAEELNTVFNIDVFAYPFNKHKGYTILSEGGNCEILILRLEDLSTNLEKALSEFLNLRHPLNMLKSNVGDEKQYADAYRNILENFRIPKAVCEKIYSTKYATHFYSDTMRCELTMKWSRENL